MSRIGKILMNEYRYDVWRDIDNVFSTMKVTRKQKVNVSPRITQVTIAVRNTHFLDELSKRYKFIWSISEIMLINGSSFKA